MLVEITAIYRKRDVIIYIIISFLINIKGQLDLSHSIDLTTMPVAGFIATKTDNTVNTKKPLAVQCGRARVVVPTAAVEAIVNIQFPEQFNGGTKPVVICTYNGYSNASDPWTDTSNPSWAGAAIGAVNVTNSGFTARCRRFDGATLLGAYYFNWIAIG